MGFILFLIIGAVAGWLAGLIMKGRGFGLLGNMVVGIVGAFLGGFLFGILG
ncbi:GlsB/YeaQ/YmgE family stress response membrane protein, partial [Rheinheimera sp. WS51]|uniref:GlsB/YeaQ/YmgE family stress response membrane protein n=1 Tax=Rheinheimera sp. WS51 TaxID=3425886 RepID=UPI003D8EDED4